MTERRCSSPVRSSCVSPAGRVRVQDVLHRAGQLRSGRSDHGCAPGLRGCLLQHARCYSLQGFRRACFTTPTRRRARYGVSPRGALGRRELTSDWNLAAQATLAKNCGGFSATYQALADYFGIPARADICWDMDNLLPANHVKEFNMKEFEQVGLFSPKCLSSPLSVLRVFFFPSHFLF